MEGGVGLLLGRHARRLEVHSLYWVFRWVEHLQFQWGGTAVLTIAGIL